MSIHMQAWRGRRTHRPAGLMRGSASGKSVCERVVMVAKVSELTVFKICYHIHKWNKS